MDPEFEFFLTNLDSYSSFTKFQKTVESWKEISKLLVGHDPRFVIGDDVILDGKNAFLAGFFPIGYGGDMLEWSNFALETDTIHITDGSQLLLLLQPLVHGNFYFGVDVDDTLVDNNRLFNDGMRRLVDSYTRDLIWQTVKVRIGPQFENVYCVHGTFPVTPRRDYRGRPIDKDLEVSMATVSVASALGIQIVDLLRELRSSGSIYATLVNLSRIFEGRLGNYIQQIVKSIEESDGPGRTNIFPQFRIDQRLLSSPEKIEPYLNRDLLLGINGVKREYDKCMVMGLTTSSHRYDSWLEPLTSV